MANVFDVADFFIDTAAQSAEGTMTNLKLNKLLYFSQGHYLAAEGKPLFSDDIEAWAYGPVVPRVYRKYKDYGSESITCVSTDYVDGLSQNERTFLLDVAREYCKYSASYLVELTHDAGTPWANTPQSEIIDIDVIAEYFRSHAPLLSFHEILHQHQTAFIGRRDDEGYLVLPSDEDDDYWDKYNEM